MMAAGANGALGGVDLLIAELLRDQPDLSPTLDIDQFVLPHDSAIPKGVRGQEMRGGKERSVIADDAKARRDGIPGDQ